MKPRTENERHTGLADEPPRREYSKPPSGQGAAGTRRSLLTLAFATGVIVLASFGAYYQEPRPDPFSPVGPMASIDFWRYPLEVNAFRRLPVIEGNLDGVFASADGTKLWAVGAGGLILHSADGGRHWVQQQVAGAPERAASAANRVPAQTSAGEWLAAWAADAPEKQSAPNAAAQTAPSIQEEAQQKAKSRAIEAGQADPVKSRPRSEQTPSPNLSAGEKSQAASEQRAESPPQQKAPDTNPDKEKPAVAPPAAAGPSPTTDLSDVVFLADGRSGWIVGDEGMILRSSDGGASWQPQASGTGAGLWSVALSADGRSGWIVGGEGTILRSSDGGASWQPQASGTGAWLRSVALSADGRSGWIVGTGGTLLRTTDGGASWQPQASGTRAVLTSVGASVDPLVAVFAGAGMIGVSRDGGQTWKPVDYRRYPAPWAWLLVAINLLVIGRSWLRLSGQQRSDNLPRSNALPQQDHLERPDSPPAPAPRTTNQDSIAELGISDRPIGWADRDYLRFKPMARALSRLLRHRDTSPPLTIAITGRWGSGKSSLMNLLKEELQSWGFRPVWFNVWHLQQEEHMLAGLLEAIRRQLVPPFFTLPGVSFRCRLLANRSKLYWLALLFVLAVVGALSAHFYKHPKALQGADEHIAYWLGFKRNAVITPDSVAALIKKERKEIADAAVADGIQGILFGDFAQLEAAVERQLQGSTRYPGYKLTAEQSAALREAAQHVPPKSGMTEVSLKVGAFLTALVAFLAVVKGASAFGLSPLGLVTLFRGLIPVKRFEERLGFRQQFADEFALITRATRKTPLTIIIDDLDRCSPENVVKTLETVNFLVSSGDCFVLLGMDRQWVEGCISLHYEKVADVIGEDLVEAGKMKNPKEMRIAFARRYLEKLVNIEVPIPLAGPRELQHLLRARKMGHQRERSGLLRMVRRFWHAVRRRSVPKAAATMVGFWVSLTQRLRGSVSKRVALAAIVAAAFVAPFGLMWSESPKAPPRPESIRGVGKSPGIEGPPPSGTLREQTTAQPIRVGERQLAGFSAGDESSTPIGMYLAPVGVAALVLLAALASGRARRILDTLPAAEAVVDDTLEFKSALEIWQPWIILRNATPRATKSFKNRVRYLAGVQRAAPSPRNLIERMLASARGWLGRRALHDSIGPPIPEPLLVAMAAIHHCDPRWLDEAQGWRLIANGEVKKLLDSLPRPAGDKESKPGAEGPTAGLVSRHQSAIDEFGKFFPGLWPPTRDQREQFLLLAGGLRTQGALSGADEPRPGA
jgi:photosystem II stability/assembly factor-like uncharacterized protein